jgi:hypothetical protein
LYRVEAGRTLERSDRVVLITWSGLLIVTASVSGPD